MLKEEKLFYNGTMNFKLLKRYSLSLGEISD